MGPGQAASAVGAPGGSKVYLGWFRAGLAAPGFEEARVEARQG
jgi:hypothetical protein